MAVILHMDDIFDWLDIVLECKDALEDALKADVEIICKATVDEARAVVEHKKLDAVILDLMMEGSMSDLRNWLKSVRDMAHQPALPGDVLAEIDSRCPSVPIGRLAAEAGAVVVILTNAEKFLPDEELDLETERRLIMKASGASAYVTKTTSLLCAELAETLANSLKKTTP